ncbi:hypothetical protein GCM10009850_070540 [Nonomuraea monospora]|uniref:Uncharacterized protein n=1 Tax=Nonomuraea monospora TaxID=568818 RepID=A0ABN3CQZ4_9ACTN
MTTEAERYFRCAFRVATILPACRSKTTQAAVVPAGTRGGWTAPAARTGLASAAWAGLASVAWAGLASGAATRGTATSGAATNGVAAVGKIRTRL